MPLPDEPLLNFLVDLPKKISPVEVAGWVHFMLDQNGACPLDDLLTMVRDELWVHSRSNQELDIWLTIAEGEWTGYVNGTGDTGEST